MCGMVPYVDFTDSKGPLLWLIYGLGYLISHHSYIGVFWISILFYTVTLFTAYKLCRLFADKDVSAISVALLPLFLFCYLFYYEVKTESFCYPFIMLALYCTCRILKYRNSDTRTYFKLSALMGVCSICCWLMKYNIGAMIMVPMAVVLYMAIRHKAGWQSFWGMTIGFIVPAIPFVIYFLIQGNMNAFIQEYFINTTGTYNKLPAHWMFLHKSNLLCHAILFVIFIGIYRFSKRNKLEYWIILCFLGFIACLGGITKSYYYMTVLPFSLFLILLIVDFVFNKYAIWRTKTTTMCALTAFFALAITFAFYHIRNFKLDEEARENYYKASYIMAQIKKPKVFNNSVYDNSVGIPAGTLPCCRYWMGQAGGWEAMKIEREKYLKSGVADFVCIDDGGNEERRKEVEELGYVYYCTVQIVSKSHITYVFGRPGLKLPPEDFHVSQWDVWLKRNIFGI